jgi:prepilin-type N-terminal cleavage/methylation domain-containing protein
MTQIRQCRGFTLVEVIVALGVSTLVVGMAWSIFSVVMGKKDGASGVVSLTADSFLRQDALQGIQSLTRRLQESIQIVEPKPGQPADKLVFRDILNQEITVQANNNELITAGPAEEQKMGRTLKGKDGPFHPATPVRVKGCSAAKFTAQSPWCIVMVLTFKDETGKTLSLLNTAELHNSDLAR